MVVSNEDTFWSSLMRGFAQKVLENLCSAKVWFFIWPFTISSFLLIYILFSEVSKIDDLLLFFSTSNTFNEDAYQFIINYISQIKDIFIAWCTFNVSLAGTIIVVREVFKVEKIRMLNSGSLDSNEDIRAVQD